MSYDVFAANKFEVLTEEQKVLEQNQIAEIANITRSLLKKRYVDKKLPVLRGVHPKSHGCVQATFEVLCDIDDSLKVGLFATPGCRDAVIRYSNASALVRDDMEKDKDGNRENGSRGMAVKVFVDDLADECFLTPNAVRNSQDFLMINTPQFAFVNVGDYLKLNQVLLNNDDVAQRFFLPAFSPEPTDPILAEERRRVLQSLGAITNIKKRPVANPLEVQYFSGAPFLFGEQYCMHFSVVPHHAPEQVISPDAKENDIYLREALQKTMAGSCDVIFDFRVQVRGVGPDLFIEDATKAWDETKYPSQTVARITIPAPQTGLDTPEHLDECEELVYTPWHGLREHQPLGSINRLRYAIYRASSEVRQR